MACNQITIPRGGGGGDYDRVTLVTQGRIMHTVWNADPDDPFSTAQPLFEDTLPGVFAGIHRFSWDDKLGVLTLLASDAAFGKMYRCVWSYTDPHWVLETHSVF